MKLSKTVLETLRAAGGATAILLAGCQSLSATDTAVHIAPAAASKPSSFAPKQKPTTPPAAELVPIAPPLPIVELPVAPPSTPSARPIARPRRPQQLPSGIDPCYACGMG